MFVSFINVFTRIRKVSDQRFYAIWKYKTWNPKLKLSYLNLLTKI